MAYPTTPRKMQRTDTGKRRRGKSQPRKLFTSGPSRTLVPRQALPEIKRLQGKLTFTNSTSFVQHSCFATQKGTGNGERIGNSLNMKAIKIHYNFGAAGLAYNTDVASSSEQQVYVVRDTEPHSVAPQDANDWSGALFADPISGSSWSTNFRNTDYTDRFQIVKKVDIRPLLVERGYETNQGYIHIPLNGVQAKYDTGVTGPSAPVNTRYYVLVKSGATSTWTAGIIVNIREEWTDN